MIVEERSCENCRNHNKPLPSLCIYCIDGDEWTPIVAGAITKEENK